MPRPIALQSVRDHVDAAEWQARVDLAACYRLMAVYGMTDLIYNHITARTGDDCLLINPYGYLYQEITASSLLRVNLAGEVLLQPDIPYGINYAGYVIHSAIHEARADAGCVIHTHTRAATAVASMRQGLMPVSQTRQAQSLTMTGQPRSPEAKRLSALLFGPCGRSRRFGAGPFRQTTLRLFNTALQRRDLRTMPRNLLSQLPHLAFELLAGDPRNFGFECSGNVGQFGTCSCELGHQCARHVHLACT